MNEKKLEEVRPVIKGEYLDKLVNLLNNYINIEDIDIVNKLSKNEIRVLHSLERYFFLADRILKTFDRSIDLVLFEIRI